MSRLAVVIATAGGAGYVPIAPGTAGSAVGILLYFLTRHWPAAWQAALLFAVSLAGAWAAHVAARHFQREDPSYVVIDEVAGQLMTVFLLDLGVVGAAAAFLLFRVLDVIKPWPVQRFEALPGGVGIVADDLAAGAIGWLLLSAGVWLWPGP